MAKLTFDSGMKLLVANDQQGLYGRAIEALRVNEKNPLAFFFLGLLASDMGGAAKALELFAKASEHGPRTGRYHAYHAKALVQAGQNPDAKLRADIAVKIGIEDAFLADMIGTVYSRTGHHELALPLFEKAVRVNPKWAIFHFNLAASAQFIGKFERAKIAYEKAVALNPQLYEAWFALTSLETQTPDNNHMEKLQNLFAAGGNDTEAQLLLGHAIAKIYEDLGQYEDSFEWLEKAKSSKRNHVRKNRAGLAKVFDAAMQAPTAPLAAQSPSADKASIFIVGLPRTGTTLVDRILSSHKSVISAGELNIFPELVVWHMGDVASLFDAAPFDLSEAGKEFTARLQGLSRDGHHVIDKTPMNFIYAGLIHRALPNAKIIALRRGAMDSCLSNYRQLFASDNPQYDYSYDLADMAAYYREFDALMTHWRNVLPADRFMEARYEDIVLDQENQTRRLLGFCGLEWDEACLRFHENTAPVDSASSVQVRQPLNAASIGRWKKYGGKLDGLKAALGDLADT